MKYRPHIDGLRAIAVTSVLLYHLGFLYLPGGFVGVDVFFVISGFLISRIIYFEVAKREFSLVRFYERRARRILPAFIVTTVATLIASYLLFLPPEFNAYAKSVLASVIFSPNLYFYETTNYFSPAVDTLPALHFWSLGVEEQFYFIFPLFVILIANRIPQMLTHCLILVIALSLGFCEVVVRIEPAAAFYLLPFRAYELLIGSFVALPWVRFPNTRATAMGATFSGIILIALAIFLFDGQIRFPGISAIIPTAGAALVLWGSDQCENPLALLLGSAPMVFIGRISYSLYLVHWPVILFASRLYPYANPVLRGTVVLGIAVLLAFASFALVEQPFRRMGAFWTRLRIFIASALSFAILAACASIIISNDGFPNRMNEKLSSILAYSTYNPAVDFRLGVCFLEPEQKASSIDLSKCIPQTNKKLAVLWGDSVAAQLYQGLRQPLEDAGFSLGQMTSSACAPILDYDAPERPNCREFNNIVFAKIVEMKPDLIILASGWGVSDESYDKFSKTISQLVADGIKPVVLGAPPRYRMAVPTLLAERVRFGDQNPFSGPDLAKTEMLSAESELKKRFARRTDVKLVSIIDLLCPNLQCPMILDGRTPVHFDTLHLTPEGSRYFGKLLVPAILG